MSPSKKKIVCDCLQVTEEALVRAVRAAKPRTLQDLTACADAGGACTACHPVLTRYLSYFASRSTCSDK